MPSLQHESLLLLFRNQPRLAPRLLRDALHRPLPDFTEVRVESADLTDVQPAEYRADLVVVLIDAGPFDNAQDRPVLGIIVEAQLTRDDAKRYSWPAYVANLRARIQCPVCLLVVAPDEQVARWADIPIEMGGDHYLKPYVLSTEMVPQITDEAAALADPELAVFSALAHGRQVATDVAAQIANVALIASRGLDQARSYLYLDLVAQSIPEAARRALLAMNPAHFQYQSDFARSCFSQGKAELLIKQATSKFGSAAQQIEARIRVASVEDLDVMAVRLLSATTPEEVLETSEGIRIEE